MKNTNLILLFICFLIGITIQAQEEERKSKFNIIAQGGIGFAIIENKNKPNYNLNSDAGEILLNYKINRIFGIATGIGYNVLTGNGFNSIGNFYLERELIKIPLTATLDYTITDKFRAFANFGFYTQNIIKEEYQLLNDSQKDIYGGWNYGVQLGLGFLFEIHKNFSAGIYYNGQTDFTNFKINNNNQGVNDEQKVGNLSTFGIAFMLDL